MLKKLLKYDMKMLGKALLPYAAVLLLLSIITRGINTLEKSFSFLKIISTPINLAFVVLLVGSLFYTFFVTMKRYYINLFKDEGYLTHTLPVTKNQLITSKMLSSMIFFVGMLFVLVLSLLIGYGDVFSSFFTAMNEMIHSMNLPLVPSYIVVVLTFFVSYVSSILLLYLSIALGHTRPSNKIMYSVVFGIVLYSVSQLIGLLEIGILYLIYPNMLQELSNAVPSGSIMATTMIMNLVVGVILTALYQWGTNFVLNKNLNLE